MSYVHETGPDGLSANALREAAAWFASMADAGVTEQERQSWHDWMKADPDHARAWRRVEEVMGRLVPLTQSAAAGTALRTSQRGRRKILGALGVLILGGGAASVTRVPWKAWREEAAMQRADYHNGIGRISTAVLKDGSRIWLGSGAVLDFQYDADFRRLRLHRGDLLVETATDHQLPARPFVVETRHGRMRALGTRFAVRADPGNSRVDVFQGAIEITNTGSDRPLHVAHAGEHTVFDGRHLLSVGQASPGREAWTRGILVADRMRLDDLIAELSRWHAMPIDCDADVAALQLVGAYPLRDVERILAAIDESLPVRVVRADGRVRVVSGPGPAAPAAAEPHDTPPRRIE